MKDNLLAFATYRSYELWNLTNNEQKWNVTFTELNFMGLHPAHAFIYNNFVVTCGHDSYVRLRDINDGTTQFKINVYQSCFRADLRL